MAIIGVDEAGYGCVAGDLVVCGLRAERTWSLPGLQDSKKLNREERSELAGEIECQSNLGTLSYAIAICSSAMIDKDGLALCHKRSYAEVTLALWREGDEVIFDGNMGISHFAKFGIDGSKMSVKSVIKADDKYQMVSGASVLAKHTHDTNILKIHELFPEYKWNVNAGYITKDHKLAIANYGLTEHHRHSYNIKL